MNKLRAALAAAILGLAATAGPVLALEEGHHLHTIVHNAPTEHTIVAKAPYTFDVELILHEQPGGSSGAGVIDWFMVSDEGVEKKKVTDFSSAPGTQKLGPCPVGECSIRFPVTVDFSTWATGRHEIRLRANIAKTFEGKRQFTTSRLYVNIGSRTPDHSERTGWYGGGGGWYTGVNYAIVVQLSPDTALRPGGAPKFRVQSDATTGCAFLNPNAHGGTMGTQLAACGTIPDSSAGKVVSIPSTADEGGKVAMVAKGKTSSHAGLYVRKLDSTPGDTAWMEWQDWWNTGGLSFP